MEHLIQVQRESDSVRTKSSLLHPLSSIVQRLDLDNVFAVKQPLEVELGSGDGSFLVERAKKTRAHNFVGVERLLGRIRKMERKARRAGLENLRGVRIESAYFMEYLLPRASTSALHIYFPDPWPKRKHRRHRLISERFPTVAKSVLKPGGVVYLRTDDQDYFLQMREVFGAAKEFESADTPVELTEIVTDFEREFLAKGIKTLRAAYRCS